MMKQAGLLRTAVFLASGLLLGVSEGSSLGAPPASAVIRYSQPVIAIIHVQVIDGTGAAPRENQTVIVARGKISAVGNDGAVRVPAGAQVINARNKTLTPGFVGTHDHLFYGYSGPIYVVREMPYSFPRLYLAGGVTTIRTAGSVEPYTDLRVKQAIDRGELVGPHIDVTSPYMTGYEPQILQLGTLTSAADARRSVDFWADRGVTSYKLYMEIPPDVARAVIAQAHQRHLRVVGHLCTIGMSEAAQMGIDSLEHGLFEDTEFVSGRQPGTCPTSSKAQMQSMIDVSPSRINALIKLLVRHHVAVSSTLANYEGELPAPMRVQQRVFDIVDAESKADVLKVRTQILSRPASRRAIFQRWFNKELAFEAAFFRAGGVLTQGPDPTGYGSTFPGIGDQRDIELLAQAGLTPVQAIQVATLNGARAMGRDATIGIIAPGKNADLVLIAGNPANNINDIENVEVVFKDGVGYDSRKIFESVRGIAGRQ
jgi:imidazolonepropionase-like amidohydrolase